MNFFVIPTNEGPYYDQAVPILDTEYVFSFRFNTRENCWRMSLLTGAREPIVEGIKLVPGVDLLAPYRYNPNVPPVVLEVLIQGGVSDDGPPGADELGEGLRAELYYVTA